MTAYKRSLPYTIEEYGKDLWDARQTLLSIQNDESRAGFAANILLSQLRSKPRPSTEDEYDQELSAIWRALIDIGKDESVAGLKAKALLSDLRKRWAERAESHCNAGRSPPLEASVAHRVRRKRERDRAAGLVRFEDLLPADDVDEVKRLCADMRERAAKHRDERARQSKGE